MLCDLIKSKLNLAIGISVLVLLACCYAFYKDNEVLRSRLDEVQLIAEQKEAAAKECSDNTILLKEAEKVKSEAAQRMLNEAKKEADDWKTKANETIFKKPKDPVITDKNSSQYGGTDTAKQLKDYLATQQLINDDIDERNKK